MSLILLITTMATAWVAGLHSCLFFQRRGGLFYPISLILCSLLTGTLLIGYVTRNPL